MTRVLGISALATGRSARLRQVRILDELYQSTLRRVLIAAMIFAQLEWMFPGTDTDDLES